MVDTVRLGGIKLSGELVQLDFREPAVPDKKLITILGKIISAKVNIPHLHQGAAGDTIQTSLCIDARDYASLQKNIEKDLAGGWLKKRPSTGTISLFPHGFDVRFVSNILNVLTSGNIPVYGISTSVSALVIHTDFSLLDDAVGQILTVCHLPENHTPLRPVIVLGDEEIETVAVYWEPQVRIYGMEVHRDLTDLQLSMSPTDLGREYQREQMAEKNKFRLFGHQVIEENQVQLSFLVEQSLEAELIELFNGDHVSNLQIYHGREVVSFHGPHFQDRYGIAAMAFSELKNSGISILRSGCTGTSIHFVVEKGRGKSVTDCLSDTFIVPSSTPT